MITRVSLLEITSSSPPLPGFLYFFRRCWWMLWSDQITSAGCQRVIDMLEAMRSWGIQTGLSVGQRDKRECVERYRGVPRGKLDELPQGRRTSDKVRQREKRYLGKLRIQFLVLTKEGLGLKSTWDLCQPHSKTTAFCIVYRKYHFQCSVFWYVNCRSNVIKLYNKQCISIKGIVLSFTFLLFPNSFDFLQLNWKYARYIMFTSGKPFMDPLSATQLKKKTLERSVLFNMHYITYSLYSYLTCC